MRPQRVFSCGKVVKRLLYGCLACVAAGTMGAVIVAHAGGSSRAAQITGPSSYLGSLPASKQPIVDHMKAMIAKGNPHPAAPDANASKAITIAPCTRDLSLFIRGLTAPHSQIDIPNLQNYVFSNEWGAPNGAESVMAGAAVRTGAGIVSVERWNPPTDCTPTVAVYQAALGSGMLTITRVARGVVWLDGAGSSVWQFSFNSDSFQEVP
ncbi:MAG: hypothetical protein WB805_11740 [Candidatus Dormiibacterota bacterium]